MNLQLSKIVNEITGITSDSRDVTEGQVYFALKGSNFNGELFINDALKKGAKYIVLSKESSIPKTSQMILVDNVRLALSKFAGSFYKKKPQNIVAVTGTNGKTSVAHFFMQLTHYTGNKSASIGTIGVHTLDKINFSSYHNDLMHLTTPDTLNLHKTLTQLHLEGITHVGLEASSHGLDQYRLDGVALKAAAFTNISRDHLDYHGNMSNYFNAKKRLFSEILHQGKHVIMNADIEELQDINDITIRKKLKLLTYGKSHNSDISILQHEGKRLTLNILGTKLETEVNLVGEFQIYNLMCAIGLLIACDSPLSNLSEAISKIIAVTGRMEKITTHNQNCPGDVYVDYAHTPDALRNALSNLKSLCTGRLIVIFGCGGERDQGKRSEMGSVAEKFADIVIVTDDNPRNENPSAIRKDIINSMQNPIEVPNRSDAIFQGVSMLESGDVLLIAGKGHEKYQLIGNEKVYFSDQDIAQDAIIHNKWKP